MGEELSLAAIEFGMKAFENALDRAMEKENVSRETRRVTVAILDQAYQYVIFCIEHGEKPDAKALASFLRMKGVLISHLSGNESLECYTAVAEFALGLRSKAAMVRGGPIGATLAASLLVLDLLEIGNSCEFAQEWYYESFIHKGVEKSARSPQITQSVQRTTLP